MTTTGETATLSTESGRDSKQDIVHSTGAVLRCKWQRWLVAVLESPRTSRELELAPVFDHVAHSTASDVRKKGVNVVTEMVEVRGYHGLPARIARYSIAPESRGFAQTLLAPMPSTPPATRSGRHA